MIQPTPVAPVAQTIPLDENFAANRVEAMRAMGAKNVDPPLPRSAYLKNTKTGVVLPWTQGLACMRDLMVNCDANGNTDPATWAHTVIQGDYSPEEQQALLDEAKKQFVQQAATYAVPVPQPAPNDAPLPFNAEPMDHFFEKQSIAMLDKLALELE